VQVPLNLAHRVPSGILEWAIPGYREEQIQQLLRGLPKTLRVPLMPLEPKAAKSRRNSKSAMTLSCSPQRIRPSALRRRIPAAAWIGMRSFPLAPRVEVLGPDKKVIAATKDFSEIQSKLENITATSKHRIGKAQLDPSRSLIFARGIWNVVEEVSIGGGLVAFPGLELDVEITSIFAFSKPARSAPEFATGCFSPR